MGYHRGGATFEVDTDKIIDIGRKIYEKTPLRYCSSGIGRFILCHLYLFIMLLIVGILLNLLGLGILTAPLNIIAGSVLLPPLYVISIFKVVRYFYRKTQMDGGGSDEPHKYDMYTFIKSIEKGYEGSKYKEKRTMFDRVFSNLIKLVVKLNLRTKTLKKSEDFILENKTNELSKSFLNKFENKLEEIKSDDSINNTMKKLKRISLIMRAGREADASKFEKMTMRVFKKAGKNADKSDLKEKYEDITKDMEDKKLSKRKRLKLVRTIRRDIKKMTKYLKSKPHDLEKILK